MSIDKELNRVLSNPENVIISDALEELLENDVENIDSEDIKIKIGSNQLICKVRKVKIQPGTCRFTLSIPSFSLSDLLKNDQPLVLEIDELVYHQLIETPVVWKDNLLTITTRRIINEAVQA